ncbi:MAG: patatin-like phospholipase family protein [Bacteroidetes bacterium]|nr:patatin-like phospholipase family protein [Bacteroidota bacterium]
MKSRGLYFLSLLLVLSILHQAKAQKVGLVLSGGGARGMAHVGVIKALEENHIPIDFIAGSSSGAIIGSMYAQGYSGDQIDSIVNSEEFLNWATGTMNEDYSFYFRKKEENASWITLRFSLDSVITTSLPTNLVSSVQADYSLMENLAPIIAKAKFNFDSLFVPFRCVAADIEHKQTVVFRKGDLAQAVRASSAYPFYFKPVILDGKILYDGGMYNNFPADIMLNDFQPDIIIGVNAGGSSTPTTEGNIVSQIRTMLTTPTNFSVLCENGILINVNTDRFGLFDFDNTPEVIQAGYEAAESKMKDILFNIQRRVDSTELKKKRDDFRQDLPKILVDKVNVEGINERQAEYVKRIIKPGSGPLPIERLKSNYFQLVADENVKSIYPQLKYNPETKMYDLSVRINREKDLITQFGGNISSRPISEVFVGAQYNIWRKKSYSFFTNLYFGKLYTSGQLKIRMDSPSSIPYFLEGEATLNQYDFYKSSTAIFNDEKPSYIIQSDYNFGINAGIPARNKGKVVLGGSYIRTKDNYYQTSEFIQKDTADESVFLGGTGYLLFERNTLNRKMYASQGTFLSVKVRYINGVEYTLPGSTSVDRQEKNNGRDWFQSKITYENYYKRRGHLKLGFFAELQWSNEPFFTNYTSTILASPSFEPVSEMQTLYLPDFHAHQYGGLGLRNVWMIRNNLDFRLEGYVFQPYRELVKTADLKTEYGKEFAKQFYIGSAVTVFHSPLGPISLSLNYYHERKNPFSFLFHFGYIIFSKSATE